MLEESYYLECDISLPYPDHQDIKSSFANWDGTPNPYTVMGRKINSEALLTNNPENTSKYPLPVKIQNSKPKRINKSHLQDISNRPRSQNSKQRYKSKTPEPTKDHIARPPSELKKIQTQKATSKVSGLHKSFHKKIKISVEIPQSAKEDSVVKKNIKSIVMQTLKKQQRERKQAEKSKIEEKERQNQIKKQLADLNKNTRLENYNRFKQEKFQPKCA